MSELSRQSSRERAVAMRAAGASYPVIARELGVNKGTIWKWCNPVGAREQWRRSNVRVGKRGEQKRAADRARRRRQREARNG